MKTFFFFPEIRIELNKEQVKVLDKLSSVERKIYILNLDCAIYGWAEDDRKKLENLKKEKSKYQRKLGIRFNGYT